MRRRKYEDMIAEMEDRGGYCCDPIGRCLRTFYSENGVPKKDIDLCLRDSQTYGAFKTKKDLARSFRAAGAKKAWLQWVARFSPRIISSPIEIWIDRKNELFREGNTDRFGYIADVESCLRYNDPSNAPSHSQRKGRDYQLDNPPDIETELESCKDSYEKEPETEQLAIIAARRGQGRFRSALIELWDRRCAVTKNRALSLLRASHIKPWRNSTNRERLDGYNGFLLIPNLDAAFDAGLISFTDTGRMLVSPKVTSEDSKSLGINSRLKLVCVFDENRPFLAEHRKLHGFPS